VTGSHPVSAPVAYPVFSFSRSVNQPVLAVPAIVHQAASMTVVIILSAIIPEEKPGMIATAPVMALRVVGIDSIQPQGVFIFGAEILTMIMPPQPPLVSMPIIGTVSRFLKSPGLDHFMFEGLFFQFSPFLKSL